MAVWLKDWVNLFYSTNDDYFISDQKWLENNRIDTQKIQIHGTLCTSKVKISAFASPLFFFKENKLSLSDPDNERKLSTFPTHHQLDNLNKAPALRS